MTTTNNKASFKTSIKAESESLAPFAEVVESSLEMMTAQSWQWDVFPRFGSLMHIPGEQIILGVVTHISTGSMDPMRYPFPYQKTESELMAEQPQIFEFLKTTFKIQVVGFADTATQKIYYMVPSKPAKIHSFVQQAPAPLVKQFFSRPDFTHLLFAFQNQLPNIDELLLVILKELGDHKLLTPSFLDEFYQTLSLLSGNDYRRLKLFLKRIEQTLL